MLFHVGVRQISGFLDTNMYHQRKLFHWVSPPTRKICVGPNASRFASQWNIGLNVFWMTGNSYNIIVPWEVNKTFLEEK